MLTETKADGEGLWAYLNSVALWDFRRLVQDGQVAIAPPQMAFVPTASLCGTLLTASRFGSRGGTTIPESCS